MLNRKRIFRIALLLVLILPYSFVNAQKVAPSKTIHGSNGTPNEQTTWTTHISDAITNGLRAITGHPLKINEHLKNSSIGLAYVLADRMACPKEPYSNLPIKGTTMSWYTNVEMKNDYAEICKANIPAKEDLVTPGGQIRIDVANKMLHAFREEFLNRYEARSGLEPDERMREYAFKMATLMVKLRVSARQEFYSGVACNLQSAKMLQLGDDFKELSALTARITEFQHALKKANRDCEFVNNRKAWTASKHVSIQDPNGKVHHGVLASVAPISDPKRKGVVGIPVATPVADLPIGSEGSSDILQDLDPEASLKEFGDGEFPLEKHGGEVLFAEEDYKKGLMPGVPYIPTAIGATKSMSFEGCKNVVIVTHRTCTNHLRPTPAHFTVGRGGEILQHGPIQNAMPSALGHNRCSIHVELSGAYNGKKLNVNGKKTHQNLYVDLTEEQTESAAAVYAFISHQLQSVSGGKFNIQLEHAHGEKEVEVVEDSPEGPKKVKKTVQLSLTPDVLTQEEIDAGLKPKDKMFVPSGVDYPVSAVVQHSQVSKDGKSSHHDDYVEREQMDELLRRARLKRIALQTSQPILTPDQVAKSLNAARLGTSSTTMYSLYTPHPLTPMVAALPPSTPEPAQEELLASDEEPFNPYTVPLAGL